MNTHSGGLLRFVGAKSKRRVDISSIVVAHMVVALIDISSIVKFYRERFVVLEIEIEAVSLGELQPTA